MAKRKPGHPFSNDIVPTGTKKNPKWTQKYVLELLNECVSLLEDSGSTMRGGLKYQPQYISFRELIQHLPGEVSYSIFLEKIRGGLRSGNVIFRNEVSRLRSRIDKLLKSIVNEGATRKELDGAFVRHVIDNDHNKIGSDEDDDSNSNFATIIFERYDSNQLTEIYANMMKEAEPLLTFLKHQSTRRVTGPIKGVKRKPKKK